MGRRVRLGRMINFLWNWRGRICLSSSRRLLKNIWRAEFDNLWNPSPLESLPSFLFDEETDRDAILSRWIVSRWNYAVSGLNPWTYHAANVFLHAAVSWLLARTCRSCFRLSGWTSSVAASLFAIHPIHTEAVSKRNNFLSVAECLEPSRKGMARDE